MRSELSEATPDFEAKRTSFAWQPRRCLVHRTTVSSWENQKCDEINQHVNRDLSLLGLLVRLLRQLYQPHFVHPRRDLDYSDKSVPFSGINNLIILPTVAGTNPWLGGCVRSDSKLTIFPRWRKTNVVYWELSQAKLLILSIVYIILFTSSLTESVLLLSIMLPNGQPPQQYLPAYQNVSNPTMDGSTSFHNGSNSNLNAAFSNFN